MNRIKNRVLKISNYIINTKSTIRETAKVFSISKSTVHKDIREKLINIDYNTYIHVSNILEEHLNTRHILGGESTKKKYEKLINER